MTKRRRISWDMLDDLAADCNAKGISVILFRRKRGLGMFLQGGIRRYFVYPFQAYDYLQVLMKESEEK